MAKQHKKMSKKSREKAIARSMGKYKSKSGHGRRDDKRNRRHANDADRFARYAQESEQIKTYKRHSRRAASEDTVIEGIFNYSGRGFGFCVPDEKYAMEDIFIPQRKTMGAMTGDRVRVRVLEKYDGTLSTEGEVISAEYSRDSIIGTLHVGRTYAYLTPDNKRDGVIVYVPRKDVDTSDARDGYKVEVCPSGEEFFTRTRPISVKGPKNMPYFDTIGRITRVFGSALSKDANYAAILYSAGIRTTFPDSVLTHADNASKEEITTNGREDLRGQIIFTIDGAGAKDLDDAISLRVTDDGKRILGVHIADVSHYVRQNTPTEEEARLRGTSVYFTDKVVPMLPESLSNGACSLNADTDKYALSAEITLDENGNRVGTRVFKSLIRSTVRGVYDEVNDIFEAGEASIYYEKYKAVYPMLTEMRKLYEQLKALSEGRGVMELEDSEATILLDGDGKPVDIIKRERGIGEKLIEQFMLQANMGVAEVLKSLGLPCLYRIHEDPSEEKLTGFVTFAHNIGLDTRGILDSEISSRELARRLGEILKDATEGGIGDVVSNVLLRSMMKAKYQSTSLPHFGLGAETYCHFTSPIRRYPDLFVHTVITTVLERRGISELSTNTPVEVVENSVPELEKCAPERGISSSECEVRAQNAERDITDMYMTLYMADKIGEKFSGSVSGVIRSGIFVRLDNLVEGFVPMTCFPGAKVNDELMTVYAGGEKITLGTRMEVILADADVSTGKITFESASLKE